MSHTLVGLIEQRPFCWRRFTWGSLGLRRIVRSGLHGKQLYSDEHHCDEPCGRQVNSTNLAFSGFSEVLGRLKCW
jgi:hypothetical protein